MRLDEHVHAEPPRLAITAARLVVVEHREHRQHRVGAVQPRLGDLARIDDEILGEDRPVDSRAAPPRRSSSEPPKKGASVSTLIASATPRIGRAPAPPDRRAGRIAPAEGEALFTSMMKRAPGRASAARRLRRVGSRRAAIAAGAAEPRGDVGALARDDRAENAAGISHC